MSLNELSKFLEQQAIRLSQESIIYRLSGRFKYKGKCLFPDDKVKALYGRPLGMFFYNLRAIFLGCGLIFLIALGLWLWLLPSTHEMRWATVILGLTWLTDVMLTLVFHRSFIKNLDRWAQQSNPKEFPPLFNRYFLIDSIIIFFLVLASQFWGLGYDAFVFLLFANVVVYSAYFPVSSKINPVVTAVFFITFITFLFLFVIKVVVEIPHLFYILLYAVPLLGMTFVIILSVLMISRFRTAEHEITINRLKLLGVYEDNLNAPEISIISSLSGAGSAISAQQFRKQVSDVLEKLCTLGPPFWYRSACLWFIEQHQDRGKLLIPAAWYNFLEAEQHLQGINPAGLLNFEGLVLVHSIKCHQGKPQANPDDFRYDLDAPAAFIPLLQNGVQVGLLTLYGAENGPPLQRQDEAFLKSLGSIISNTLKQWENLYKVQPLQEMDNLFEGNDLQEVFQKTTLIMQEYLGAAGCMVVFRPEPNDKAMHIQAKIGISDSIYKTNVYEVGKGLTGECAATGQAIRIDNVLSHRTRFDNDMLEGIEQAHMEVGGHPIVSWMAIPIGTKNNYGVIKVINRKFRSTWFSQEDEQLGISLALRLQVIIEKFLSLDKMKLAMEDAQTKSKMAQDQSEKAEAVALQRQEDLMVTMHQLQGPLSSMLGSISYLKTNLVQKEILKSAPRDVQKDIEEELINLEDFVNDSLALSYGTFTTFAIEAGRQASFGIHKINAPQEMEKLARRLQKTNSRSDLDFSFFAERDFPILKMDKNVFTSVLYSLIHNAMKYADKNSEVSLVCATERNTKKPVLKVKSIGVPIHEKEKDKIFKKFGRGRVISQTGRYHSGVGLGLWVAKQLMLTIGGDLTVELSPSNPRLSVFMVHIPIAEGVESWAQNRPLELEEQTL
jgi:signal transduction histidine kinase